MLGMGKATDFIAASRALATGTEEAVQQSSWWQSRVVKVTHLGLNIAPALSLSSTGLDAMSPSGLQDGAENTDTLHL